MCMGQMKWAIRDTQLCNLNHTSCKVGARDVAKTRELLYFLRLLYSLTFDTDNCDVKIHMVEPFFSLKAHKVKNEKFCIPVRLSDIKGSNSKCTTTWWTVVLVEVLFRQLCRSEEKRYTVENISIHDVIIVWHSSFLARKRKVCY